MTILLQDLVFERDAFRDGSQPKARCATTGAASLVRSATQRAASLPIPESRRSRIGSALKRKRIERDSYGAKVAALAG
jgi:hypothetical protein